MCYFCLNGRPFRDIFHRFQNVPASCEGKLMEFLPCMIKVAIIKIYLLVSLQYTQLFKVRINPCFSCLYEIEMCKN